MLHILRDCMRSSLEVLELSDENITLCRIPSHLSHKIQPCNVAVFSSWKVESQHKPTTGILSRLKRATADSGFKNSVEAELNRTKQRTEELTAQMTR
jgi:hypothetical protein